MFRFKEFEIEDKNASMKVGTDAVLLGAWAEVSNAQHILDVGTGCGIIALMLAQRTTEGTTIEGVDIDDKNIRQANENLMTTRWCNRVLFHHASLQSFHSLHQYDLIVSNPPYFQNSLLPPTHSRQQARHNHSLPFEDLITHSKRLLKVTGKLCLILPVTEGNQFKESALQHHLCLEKEVAVFIKASKPQERWLLEFSLSNGKTTTEKIVLFDDNGSKSKPYQNLTDKFYL
ncbi:MAG: methyltransferase [Bacteroidetes bacterium]|nr:methyltransferase [Bacteroidota bacterium]MBS1541682.1 methyltransferase [Bacteroidota bacterium]